MGEDQDFREGQLEAILALVDERARVLVVQRTGWGKSVVYFLATQLLRGQGSGPTILISPLLSLMRDQIMMAGRLGIRATKMDSTNPSSWDDVEAALAADEIDVLLVSPERLANERFHRQTLASIPLGIGLLVVDEAHCISDWGHDFRPDYRRIRRITQALPPSVPLLATTATANDRVVADIEDQLGPDLVVIRGRLGRDSLHLQVIELDDQAKRLAWLAEYLPRTGGSGIIYVLTVADARRVSSWLAEHDIHAPAYYGELDDETRTSLEEALRRNEVKALVATVALGMGFDKPDLAFVVHFQRPGSPIAYYQQIGRAGRAVERAEVVLLSGHEDDAITDYFIHGAFPAEQVLCDVLSVTNEIDSATMSDLEGRVNAKRSVIERALKILEVDGAIVHEGGAWVRTVNPWSADSARVEAVTAARRDEQETMREYVQASDCLMRFLVSELDGPDEGPCGRCAVCSGDFAGSTLEPSLVQQAQFFLRRAYRPILPRKQWPAGLAMRSGRIPVEHQLREGRALTIYGDAGWGQEVKAGKYGDEGFSDQLVDATVEMIKNDLQPDPFPTWVTAVPSRRHPNLVPDFAQRLADRLGLPYRLALVKVTETPQQKSMQNSPQQARNAMTAFAAVNAKVLPGPVLLVDDMVDSRWSLTVCGVMLAEAGSGPVVPVALGQTSTGVGA